MADKKISALTSLAQGDVAVTTDVLPIVDTSATETKKVTAAALVGAGLAAGVTSVDINSGSIDGTTIGANSAAAGTFTNLTASGTVSFSGATVSNGGSVTTVDINGGTIDGATIATSDITVGSGKTLNVSAGTLTLADNQISGDKVEGGTINAITINTLTSTAVNATTVDATNVEVTNVKAKDGTAAATIADSTGVVSITANPILSGGTANGVLYLNGSKVATSGTALVFDGTNVGIGTTSPRRKLEVAGAAGASAIQSKDTANSTNFFRIFSDVTDGAAINVNTGGIIRFAQSDENFASFSELMRLTSTGLGIGTSSPAEKLTVDGNIRMSGNRTLIFQNSTTTAAGAISWRESDGTQRSAIGSFYNIADEGNLEFINGTSTNMVLNSSGNLGLGVTPSAWGNVTALQVEQASLAAGSVDTYLSSNAYYSTAAPSGWKYISSTNATQFYQNAAGGEFVWRTSASGTAGNAITFTQAMTLDASGNLGVGVTSPSSRVEAWVASSGTLQSAFGASNGANADFFVRIKTNETWLGPNTNTPLIFANNSNTERARITSGGNLLVGKTADDLTTNGAVIRGTGIGAFSVDQDTVLFVDRTGNDGTLVSLRQANVEEGSISVSGNTVSYNAFAGSHWSQLQDGSKPDILRGTVMESINELCVWPGEQNERLPKSKISDTAGSKKVYGVFMAWDNDWDTTNDMYVTAVGAFICRVNGSVTVQEGDLLESNGDGTARVQADDIIRSSTIGKVTSTVKTHEYDDGSYCVPTVLYCG